MSANCLLPHFIDDLALNDPDRILTALTVGEDISNGIQDITAKQFANAVDRAAWFIEKTIGRSDTFQTLPYIGPQDLRYTLLTVAASKTGYKSFFISPRNSFEGQTSLLRETQCTFLFTPPLLPAGIGPVVEYLQLRRVIVPELSSWLTDECPSMLYTFTKTYEELSTKPLMVIHTSGSSGIPKPIVIPFGFFTSTSAFIEMQPVSSAKKSMFAWMRERPGRILHPFPFFHGAGIYFFFTFTLFLGQIPVIPPARPFTSELAIEYHRSGYVSSAFLPPSILEEITLDPTGLESLANLNFIISSGAALSCEIGDTANRKARIVNLVGQTEAGLLPHLYVEDKDYAYVCYDERGHVEMRHHSGDLYEAVVVRTPGCEVFQPPFMVQPWLQEHHMHDLFKRHSDPTKSDHWLHSGRADSIIVLDNGEKLNPVSMEQLLVTHPNAKSALVVGSGRFQPAVLIEHADDSGSQNTLTLVEELWPLIEEANTTAPAHGRLIKELVILTDPSKPLLYTAKSTIQRKESEELYKGKLDQVYDALNDSMATQMTSIEVGDDLEDNLRQIIVKETKLILPEMEVDFFILGMDSLIVLKLCRALKQSLRLYPKLVKALEPIVIYRNSTLSKLTQAIRTLWQKFELPEGEDQLEGQFTEHERQSREEHMRAVLSSYAKGLPQGSTRDRRVILTGSTGGLGSYILDVLVTNPEINHVYCLNRSPTAAHRQANTHHERGLASPIDQSQVTFLCCDLTRDDLGLDPIVYQELVENATDLIHNAWTVNFNHQLDSFAPSNIAGLRNLINFAIKPSRSMRFLFVSSIGTIVRWKAAGHSEPVPEVLHDDVNIVEAIGYSESKWVAEQLLAKAAHRSNLTACIARVGQIAGPIRSSRGQWTLTEWFPSLVMSSYHLGVLPSSFSGNDIVDWIPVDQLAQYLVELLEPESVQGGITQVYHLINPRKARWADLLPVVQRRLTAHKGCDVRIADYNEWLSALLRSAEENEDDTAANPAVKLLDFFSAPENAIANMPEISTEKAREKSTILNACGPVVSEWMELWMEQWGF